MTATEAYKHILFYYGEVRIKLFLLVLRATQPSPSSHRVHDPATAARHNDITLAYFNSALLVLAKTGCICQPEMLMRHQDLETLLSAIMGLICANREVEQYFWRFYRYPGPSKFQLPSIESLWTQELVQHLDILLGAFRNIIDAKDPKPIQQKKQRLHPTLTSSAAQGTSAQAGKYAVNSESVERLYGLDQFTPDFWSAAGLPMRTSVPNQS